MFVFGGKVWYNMLKFSLLFLSMNLFPQDTSYSEAFDTMSRILLDTVSVVTDADTDLTRLAECRAKSSKLETEADMQTHSIIQKLHKSPNPPYDRNDIFSLVEWVDEIIDRIDHFMHDIEIYGISESRHYLGLFTPLYLQWGTDTQKVLRKLFEPTFDADAILKSAIMLRSIGSHGETAYEKSLRDLFATCKDPILIIKWKAIIEAMRSITRAYKTLGSIIEDILMKNW